MSRWHEPRKLEVELAEFAAQLTWKGLPSDVRERVKLIALDTIAHMLAGSREEPARTLLASYPTGARGRATILGTRRRAAASIAGYLNGVTATITQFDEGHLYSRGHPAINTVPAVLAVGEELGVGGTQLLEALVTGYEVGARVGMAVGALRPGLHPHGMSGAIGAAAGVGKLLKFDATRLRHLLNASATMTLFPQDDTSYAGATIHHCFIGVGASNAIHAALAVAAGLTAAEGALTEFYLPLAGQQPEPTLLTAGLDQTFEIRRGFFKIYPACGHIGSPVEALRQAGLDPSTLDPDRIQAVRIRAYRAAAMCAEPHPVNALAAKFSVPYCVAVYLRTGRLDLDSFTTEFLTDPSVRLLAEKVELREDSSLTPAFPAGRPAQVEVVLKDGSVRTATIGIPRGNHGNPVPDDAIMAKAEGLLRRAGGLRRAVRLRQVLLGLDRLDSLTELSRLLSF